MQIIIILILIIIIIIILIIKNGGASTHEPSACADSNDNNCLQKEQEPPSGPNSGSSHPISGTIFKAVKAATYVDFVDPLPCPKVKHNMSGDVVSGTGDQKASATQNVTIESFDSWLEAWSIYEALVMDVEPSHYKDLVRYRDVIQTANRKHICTLRHR